MFTDKEAKEVARKLKAKGESWFDSHVEVIGLDDETNAKIKAALKASVADKAKS